MNYDELSIGQEIYYTGDMANTSTEGKIIKKYSNSFYPVLYDIQLTNKEGERVSKGIFPVAFQKSPGRRFIVREEYQKERQEKIKELKERMKTINNAENKN